METPATPPIPPTPAPPAHDHRTLIVGAVVVLLLAVPVIMLAYLRLTPARRVHRGGMLSAPDLPAAETATETPTPTSVPRPLATGKQTFTVMNSADAKGPRLKEVTIDPYDARNGRQQMISLLVTDPAGVVSASVTVATDSRTTDVPLQLAIGTATEGVWAGTWTVNDTTDTNYAMKFHAVAGGEQADALLTIR